MVVKQRGAALAVVLGATVVTGCDIDKNAPEYDELRYEQLQKASCSDMASILSEDFLMEKPDDFDVAKKRCEDTKSLSLVEYKHFADESRASGVWDIYAVFPEKQ